MKPITENIIEELVIENLRSLGWQYEHGLAIAPGAEKAERESFEEIILTQRLRKAVATLNPHIPEQAREQAIRKIQNIVSPDLLYNNELFHEFLIEGVKIPYQQDGYERSYEVQLIDFNNAANNEFLVVNQYIIVEKNINKRPDVLLFINGIPVVVMELKNAADENATIERAYDQLQTYKATIPSLFTYNSVCVISDGHKCRAGTLSSNFSRFMMWKSADGVKDASRFMPQIEVLVKGMLNQSTLLDLIRNFIVFEKTSKEDPKTGLIQISTEKKLAAYHQYFAVNKAVESTVKAVGNTPYSGSSSRGKTPSTSSSQGEEKPSTGSSLREERNMRGGIEFAYLKERARALRRNQTSTEELFWKIVRNRNFENLKFRRQHQIGNYIVDFYCHEHKLVIEFDGDVHNSEEQKTKDKTRDQYLTSLGNTVLRFKNEELFENADIVFKRIADTIFPSPRGEGQGEVKPSPLGEGLGEGKIGSKKAGVIWHTQGSGKSLSMVFYAAKLITTPEMQNPTIVVITDRNDLDDQLFGTFAASKQLLRQEPVQAESRSHLKELLKVTSGGIVFTTIQKFMAEGDKTEYDLLSSRDNIVVIADEAHRTQYGFEAVTKEVKDENNEVIGKRITYGFAKFLRDALPNATYIGFTGTPIESSDVNTPQVFGQYIDIYDIAQSVADGATVRIYYESRLAKVNLSEEGKRLIEEFDRELEESEEITEKQRAKAKWAKLEAIVGNKERIKNLGKDIVTHFEQRQNTIEGKGMIVTMSRRIAAELYHEIIALRPQWHSDELTKGAIKVVMTASSDEGPLLAKFKTTKAQRQDLADRMRDPADELKLVIVRDMWLTGFDAPSLHTMYIDKPMRGHNLMQAIARVNRVFKDKPGGLIVDYLGIASDLKKALSFYSDAGGKGEPTVNLGKAIELMEEKLEVVQQMFNAESATRKDILVEEPFAYYQNSFKFNYKRFFTADAREKLSILLQAEEHILGLENGKERFLKEVTMLSKAFALSIPHEKAMQIKDEVAFFQAVKARLIKFEPRTGQRSDTEIETAIKQIVDEALTSDQVIDVFDAAGIKKPDISILSEEFMSEVQGMKHKNLAFELLRRLLNDEIKSRLKTNLVKSKKFLEMLEGAIKRYQNNLLSTAEIIQELINIAREIKEADKEGERLGLREDEVAFYNALEVNDSAVMVLGDETLKEIAREVAEKVRANATIDWTIRESARAKLMVMVKRTLNKYKYPPDKQEKAVDTVLKQAELMADMLVG